MSFAEPPESGVLLFLEKKEEIGLGMQKETSFGGLNSEVLDAFHFAAHFYLVEDHPMFIEIRDCLMRGDPATAVYHVKAIKYRLDPPPPFLLVERMVYASICPHINA